MILLLFITVLFYIFSFIINTTNIHDKVNQVWQSYERKGVKSVRIYLCMYVCIAASVV